MRNAIGRGAVSLGVMAILLLAATEAGAGQTFCGTTSAGWNVPNGDAVFVSGPGPDLRGALVGRRVSLALDALQRPRRLGDPRHVDTPPTSGDMSPYWTPFCSSCGSECWNPISTGFLQNSMPGLEQVSQGGIYTFLYGNGSENFIASPSASYVRRLVARRRVRAPRCGNFAWAGAVWAGRPQGNVELGTSYAYGVAPATTAPRSTTAGFST